MFRALIVIAVLAALPGCRQRAPGDGQSTAEADGPVKGVDRSHQGKVAPVTEFNDPAGKGVTLAAFKGRPLLVNLWASWCAPCVKELPTLDRLARANRGVTVVAISEDSAGPESVVAFLKTNKIVTLAPYHDPGMAMSGTLGAEVLPTSILYDAQGRELWRYVGDLDWTGAEATKLLGEAAAR